MISCMFSFQLYGFCERGAFNCICQDMMVISSKDEGVETIYKEGYSFANKNDGATSTKNVNKNIPVFNKG